MEIFPAAPTEALASPELICYTNASFGAIPDGRIAQLVEQLTLNQRVLGSSPSAPTIKIKTYGGFTVSDS